MALLVLRQTGSSAAAGDPPSSLVKQITRWYWRARTPNAGMAHRRWIGGGIDDWWRWSGSNLGGEVDGEHGGEVDSKHGAQGDESGQHWRCEQVRRSGWRALRRAGIEAGERDGGEVFWGRGKGRGIVGIKRTWLRQNRGVRNGARDFAGYLGHGMKLASTAHEQSDDGFLSDIRQEVFRFRFSFFFLS